MQLHIETVNQKIMFLNNSSLFFMLITRGLLFLVLCAFKCNAQSTANAWVKDMYDHKHALIMRHSKAPGIGDPAGFKIEECTTQRNLNEEGRIQSIETGEWLKKQGLERAAVYSSPWCRTLDTAKLLNMGAVSVAPELASTFENKLPFANKKEDLQRFIVNYLHSDQKLPLILVTHEVNIFSLLGVQTGSGEMVVLELTNDDQIIAAHKLTK